MNRRNFLSQSGILIPALIAVPSAVLAGPKTTTISVLVVQGASQYNTNLSASVKKTFGKEALEIGCKELQRLEYTGSGFSVLTADNRVIRAKKIILNISFKINTGASSLAVKTVDKEFDIDYKASATSPEFWSFGAEHLSSDVLLPFARRKKNAFLCVQ